MGASNRAQPRRRSTTRQKPTANGSTTTTETTVTAGPMAKKRRAMPSASGPAGRTEKARPGDSTAAAEAAVGAAPTAAPVVRTKSLPAKNPVASAAGGASQSTSRSKSRTAKPTPAAAAPATGSSGGTNSREAKSAAAATAVVADRYDVDRPGGHDGVTASRLADQLANDPSAMKELGAFFSARQGQGCGPLFRACVDELDRVVQARDWAGPGELAQGVSLYSRSPSRVGGH